MRTTTHAMSVGDPDGPTGLEATLVHTGRPSEGLLTFSGRLERRGALTLDESLDEPLAGLRSFLADVAGS